MILTEDYVKSITDEYGIYSCGLLSQQFAYKILRENISPLGDIFCFNSACKIGPLGLLEGLIFIGELPNTNMFGTACFQRLYASQLGKILSSIIQKEFYIEDSCIFVEGKQASITILNQVKDSGIFHIAFPISVAPNLLQEVNLFELKLDEEQEQSFKQNAINSFRHLTSTIFIETRRDNF